MKRVQWLRWSRSTLSSGRGTACVNDPSVQRIRALSTEILSPEPSSPVSPLPTDDKDLVTKPNTQPLRPRQASRKSAKLAALHARLSLSSKFPLETLARTLRDPTAAEWPMPSNKSLSILGNDLLGYYTSDYILCQYPRLPLAVVFAAMYAYAGSKTLASLTREWGVEAAAAPDHNRGEVDPGLLQFKRIEPGTPHRTAIAPILTSQPPEGDPAPRRGWSNRTVHNDMFGQPIPKQHPDTQPQATGITLEEASHNFVRAVLGAVYMHNGRVAAKQFFGDHWTSRQLDFSKLFNFRAPTEDLARLCAREGFISPVARIISETGRKSRHPVFVVGVFSGNEKLGEGQGSSLDEARIRAAVAALKGWYLYSPLAFRVTSETEEPGHKPWTPALIDPGEIIS